MSEEIAACPPGLKLTVMPERICWISVAESSGKAAANAAGSSEDVTEDRTSLSDKLSCDGSKAGNCTSERSSEDISSPDKLIDEKFSACELKLNAEDSTLGSTEMREPIESPSEV